MKKSFIVASVFAVTALSTSMFVSAEEAEPTEKVLTTESIVLEEAAVEAVVTEEALAKAIEAGFQSMDANQDGAISIEEAEMNDMLLEAFPQLDLDKTADLSKEEYSKFDTLTK